MDNSLVVILMLAGFGNSILAIPMVRQLKRAMPKSLLLVLARTSGAFGTYSRLEEVSEVIRLGSYWRSLSELRDLRKRKPEIVLVPFPSNRWQYMTIALLTGAQRRIIHRYQCGFIKSLSLIPAERVDALPVIHDVAQNLNLLKALGIEADFTEEPVFPLSEEDKSRAGRLLLQDGFSGDSHFIAIHPGSSKSIYAPTKRWPPERWGELIAEINRRWDIPVVMLEGPAERGLGDEISAFSQSAVFRVVRPERVGDAAGILFKSLFCVCIDSAMGHLASAVGKKVIALFGAADPDRICPVGSRELVVGPENLSCAPCLRYPLYSANAKPGCRHPRCPEAISVKSVLKKMEQVIGVGNNF